MELEIWNGYRHDRYMDTCLTGPTYIHAYIHTYIQTSHAYTYNVRVCMCTHDRHICVVICVLDLIQPVFFSDAFIERWLKVCVCVCVCECECVCLLSRCFKQTRLSYID